MKTVAIYNNKGGVGKTTLTAHLIYAADLAGVRTLGVAMDRQGDLPKWLSRGDAVKREGGVVQFSKHVAIVYSPEVPPSSAQGADLVVIDTPPDMAIASTVTADLWIAPCDGRMALEDLANVLPTMLRGKAEVLVVFNRAEVGGVRALEAMHRAARAVPRLDVSTLAIPESAAIKRSGEFYMPAWEVPYGLDTQGARAIRAFADGVLARLGVVRASAPAASAPRSRVAGQG